MLKVHFLDQIVNTGQPRGSLTCLDRTYKYLSILNVFDDNTKELIIKVPECTVSGKTVVTKCHEINMGKEVVV